MNVQRLSPHDKENVLELAQRDFLRDYLAHAPMALALLRAIECRELANFEFQRPVLDLGCGDGLFGQMLFKKGPEYGLDRSLSELYTARQRGVYRALVCADMAWMPFADGTFATILSNGVLEHVRDLRRALTEIARVLHPKGRLIFTVPIVTTQHELYGAVFLRALGLHALAHRYADFYNRVFEQINVYTLEEWRQALSESGLRLVHHRTYAPPLVFRLHDFGAVSGLFHLLIKRLTGRWTLWPQLRYLSIAWLWSALLRNLYRDNTSSGCSLLMVAERARDI